ncbi:hypothetical protein MPOCJGCO_1050 [Methylobacterium trifolii]|uniref:Uncharacterized protein n=1 Tax=Methylobacterium trifolii TaxID=1003092 RepID=A0ABQ4TUJ1_9HYPH|nr:hypothetical protein MPOCJGCO_1050 [Methylobacterium trifolii]
MRSASSDVGPSASDPARKRIRRRHGREQGTRDAAGTLVGSARGYRSPRRPVAGRSRRRTGRPSSRRGVSGPIRSCGPVSSVLSGRTPRGNPDATVGSLPTSSALVVARIRRLLRMGPEPGRGTGHLLPRAGRSCRPSHATARADPASDAPPGAMAAEATDAGTAPLPRPRRSTCGRTPCRTAADRSVAAGQRMAGIKHKTGTLSSRDDVQTRSPRATDRPVGLPYPA